MFDRPRPRPQPSQRPATGIATADDPAILAAIAEPDVALALWDRRPSPAFAAWIDALPVERLPRLSALVAFGQVAEAVTAACDRAGLPATRERRQLAEDAGALGLMAASALGAAMLRVRLEVTTETTCPRFHVDQVRARLVCTYRGRGTQVTADGPGADPARIRELCRGAVGLFRGARWPGAGLPGLLHRSPPAGGAAGPRLLLVIDPAEPEPDPC